MTIAIKFARRLLAAVVLMLGLGTAQAETVIYYHTDAIGTPVAVTDASGNVIERSEHEPYGRLLNRLLTDGPGYTGHVSDAATALSYMQQRYYDPGVGRFLSVDPVTANSSTGANFNRYWYADNNPYTNNDPDGRACNGNGCWVTKEERAAVQAKDWKRYYYLAGIKGNDQYARRAGEVASNTGHDDISRTLSAATNINLERGIVESLPGGMPSFLQRIAVEFTKESIRVYLSQGHAALLDSYNATESNPVQLDRGSDLTQMHYQVFKRHGVDPDVFGGQKIDNAFGNSPMGQWGNEKLKGLYDWCPSPSCKK